MSKNPNVGGIVILVLLVVAVVWGYTSSLQEEREQAARAKATAARIAAMTPEQKKAEADRRKKAAAEKRRQDARVQIAAAGARLLKKSMNNPDAFTLESALVIDKTGAVCYQFRGQNAFGAIVRGQAALSRNGKRFLLNTDDGFARFWNAQCAGKTGSEYATAIRWLAL
jgi:hypothetical protein